MKYTEESVMGIDHLESTIYNILDYGAGLLENRLECDVVFYNGGIMPSYFRDFRNFIELVKKKSSKKTDTLSMVLRTPGGSAETTERMVGVLRQHYKKLNFIVPDYAMSAGTIFCMSGDKIYMDYASSLGPIDPQVPADTGEYVPAMGYLDKVDEITAKEPISSADVILLKSIDLARLAVYEQARDLSVDLLKRWLVEYKFKDWTHHSSEPTRPVTDEEKKERAERIAKILANHKLWRSHGRNLDIVKLSEMKLRIDDYSKDEELSELIRGYNDPLTDYIDRTGKPFFMHNANIRV